MFTNLFEEAEVRYMLVAFKTSFLIKLSVNVSNI